MFQFHQRFTSSCCAWRSQKPKSAKRHWRLDCLFVLLGSAPVKATRKHVGEIDSIHVSVVFITRRKLAKPDLSSRKFATFSPEPRGTSIRRSSLLPGPSKRRGSWNYRRVTAGGGTNETMSFVSNFLNRFLFIQQQMLNSPSLELPTKSV